MTLTSCEAYNALCDIWHLDYDQFCVECDLKFSDCVTEPIFGSLVLRTLVDDALNRSSRILEYGILSIDAYQKHFTTLMCSIDSNLHKVEYCAKHTPLFDAYLSESYFYSNHGDESIFNR